MWRSDCESRILNTYVPAGNTPHPLRWTPGISTGPLKVITVFLFQSSALAPGASTAAVSATKHTVVAALNSFMFFLFPLDFRLGSFCGSLRFGVRQISAGIARVRYTRYRGIPETTVIESTLADTGPRLTGSGHPLIRKLVTLVHNPTAWSSHTQTATTTTMFKIVLMLEAMGIYRLIRYKTTPTTTNTMTRFSNGILQCSWNQKEAFQCPIARRRVRRELGKGWNAPDERYDAAILGKEMSWKPQRKLSARGNTGLAGACGRAEVWVTRVA